MGKARISGHRELHAILVRKYFMSQELGREVTVREAIDDFQLRFEEKWLSVIQMYDNKDQVQAMLAYFENLKRSGHDLRKRDAALRWVEDGYAEKWRMQIESITANVMVKLGINAPDGSLMRIDTEFLKKLSYDCDCEIFVHKPRLKYADFIMKDNGHDKEYLSVRTPSICPDEFSAITKVEFLAFGKGAREALLEIQKYADGRQLGCVYTVR